MVMMAIVLESSFEFGSLLFLGEVERFGLPDELTETCHPVDTFFVQDGDIEENTSTRSVSEPLQFRCMYLKQSGWPSLSERRFTFGFVFGLGLLFLSVEFRLL